MQSSDGSSACGSTSTGSVATYSSVLRNSTPSTSSSINSANIKKPVRKIIVTKKILNVEVNDQKGRQHINKNEREQPQSSNGSLSAGSVNTYSSVLRNWAPSTSSTVDLSNFKKPPGNISITKNRVNDEVNDQKLKQINKNEREQQRLNLDVILWGFPLKPECMTVVPAFLSICKVPIEKVKTFYQFESKKGHNSFHHIVITFKDKPSKLQLFKAHDDLQRPIRWSELCENNVIYHNPIIRFNNRFSRFNLAVEKQLQRLKTSGIILEHKFEDLFYYFKQTPTSDWKVVSTVDDCDYLIEFLEYVTIKYDDGDGDDGDYEDA